jgi:HAD superfamily hydrolase (TIGR01509 family)
MGMSGMTAELIIFDCDGVLIDSEIIACRTDATCLAEVGIAMTTEEVLERYVGISAKAMFADIEARTGVTLPTDFAQTLQRRIAEAFDAELTAMPGIEQALATLTSKICVASSSAPERLRQSLSGVGLLHYFEPHIFSASQVASGKPAPDLFLFAAQQMHIDPTLCLVIEDSVAGVEAAVAAGMHVLGFTGGSHCRPNHRGRLLAAGAPATFAHMGELSGLI